MELRSIWLRKSFVGYKIKVDFMVIFLVLLVFEFVFNFDNFLSLLFVELLSARTLKLFLSIKFLIVGMVGLFSFILIFCGLKRWQVYFLIWICILSFAFILSSCDAKLIYLVRYSILFFLPFVFSFFYTDIWIARQLIKIFFFLNITILLLMLTFGVIEYRNDYLWNHVLNLPDFWNKIGDRWAVSDITLSGRFYSYDLYFVFGKTIRRLVSFYMEPTTLSSYLIFMLYITYYFNFLSRTLKVIVLTIIITMGLMTISKAFILSLLLLPLSKFFTRFSPVKLLMGITVISYLSAVAFSILFKFGGIAHVIGFIEGVNTLFHKPLGYGLGCAGNYGNFLNIGGESALGSLIAQVGLLTFIFILAFMALLDELFKFRYFDVSIKLNYILLIVWYVMFIFSESAVGFRGNIFVFVLTALNILYINSIKLELLRKKEKEVLV